MLTRLSLLLFLMIWNCPVGAAEMLPDTVLQEIQALKETVAALESAVNSQNEILQKQSVRISALEQGEPAPKKIARPQGAPELAGPSQGFNPDIAVLGKVQAQLTESTEDAEGRDTIALKELELAFAQYVDPHSRLDAFLDINDNLEAQNIDIEEAYYTHWGLPWGFLGRIGKFRAKIGKQNLLHLDQLDTVDFPLVVREFFGEEGLSASGLRLQNWIPNPWDLPLQVTAEVFRGNNGPIFSGISRRPIFNTHLKSFFELSKDASLELGTTVMFGDENTIGLAKGEDRYGVHLFGWDATLLWYLSEGRQVKFQTEAYFGDKSNLVTANHDPWGFYTLLDYKFSPKWSAGVRFDYLEPRAVTDGHGRTTSISPYLTFWQSEFANFRLQYSHTDPADPGEKADDAIFLEANFLIGTHRHPVQ